VLSTLHKRDDYSTWKQVGELRLYQDLQRQEPGVSLPPKKF